MTIEFWEWQKTGALSETTNTQQLPGDGVLKVERDLVVVIVDCDDSALALLDRELADGHLQRERIGTIASRIPNPAGDAAVGDGRIVVEVGDACGFEANLLRERIE